MELNTMLQQYLIESHQIDAFAVRQVNFISRAVTDASSNSEIKIICLLVLAVLQKGSPRADQLTLLAPLEPNTIRLYAASWSDENGRQPDWLSGLDHAFLQIKIILGNLFSNPTYYAPITGALPAMACRDGIWPILVVHQELVGFSRYWSSARILEQEHLPLRLAVRDTPPSGSSMKKALNHVFTHRSILKEGSFFHIRQIAAAALACCNRFCILSGGPGTGKTSVVLQILRTLLQVYPEISTDRIVLCAPTGRAKARLGESIDKGLATLTGCNDGPHNEMDNRDTALGAMHRKTIHSLLGQHPNGTFKYNRDKKLPYQVVIVDESSMVPLNLFAALLEACDNQCRILLVGDMHQLPSVEAGAVLGDLTGSFSATPGYPSLSGPVFSWIKEVTAGIIADDDSNDGTAMVLPGANSERAGTLTDHAIILTRSYRSSKAILTLAEAINSGDSNAALTILHHPENRDQIRFNSDTGIEPVAGWLDTRFNRKTAIAAYTLLTCAQESSECTAALIDTARTLLYTSTILTLTHDGIRGRKAINRRAEQLLRAQLHCSDSIRPFPGLPIILGTNHHDLDLYNGDLGIVIRTATQGLKAIFPRGNNIRLISLDRLRDYEPAFALTVHKSQGSEFDSVLLVLPERESPLLTRQIIYTGITRAKKEVAILGTEIILRKAIEHREERGGGVEIEV